MANAAALAFVAVLCFCTLSVSVNGLPAGGLTMIEDEPAAKRRGMSMIDLLRNPYESFDDVARQDWRTAVQGYFDVMNKIGKTKSGQSPQVSRDSPDSYIKRYM